MLRMSQMHTPDHRFCASSGGAPSRRTDSRRALGLLGAHALGVVAIRTRMTGETAHSAALAKDQKHTGGTLDPEG